MDKTIPTIMEKDVNFRVDQETCIKCGLCAGDCPFGIIQLEGDDFPKLADDKLCIRCQHCFAVCPTASLSVLGQDPQKAQTLKQNLPDKDQFITLVKGRRSVRHYKDENLPKEVIDEMVDAVWHAPTGHNFQQNVITVIGDKDVVADMREEVYSKIESELAKNGLKDHPGAQYFGMAVQMRKESGVDIIFRGAPHIILVSVPDNGASPVQDSLIAMTTFDLLAPTMGVGTLWNGMLKWALGLFPEIQEKLGIPQDHYIGYAMVFGKPAVKYARTTMRGAARVNNVSSW